MGERESYGVQLEAEKVARVRAAIVAGDIRELAVKTKLRGATLKSIALGGRCTARAALAIEWWLREEDDLIVARIRAVLDEEVP